MKTILVVEDEMQIARLVRDYLEEAGFAVTVAGDGEAALRAPAATGPTWSCSTWASRAATASTWPASCAARRTCRS